MILEEREGQGSEGVGLESQLRQAARVGGASGSSETEFRKNAQPVGELVDMDTREGMWAIK